MSSLSPIPSRSLGFVPGAQAPRKPVIFVSCTHVNDEVLPAARAWGRRALVDHIQALLRQAARPQGDFAISLDRHALTRNDPWTDQIVDAARQSDVLLAASFVGYTRSGWCGKERKESLQAGREHGPFERVPAAKAEAVTAYALIDDGRHGKACAVYGIALSCWSLLSTTVAKKPGKSRRTLNMLALVDEPLLVRELGFLLSRMSEPRRSAPSDLTQNLFLDRQ